MHYLFNKKTFMGVVALVMVLSMLLNPSKAYQVDAQGGTSFFIPQVMVNNRMAPADGATIFGPNATWKFLDNGTVPASGWLAPTFDDSTWKSGSAPLGYGYSGLRTTVSYGPSSSEKYRVTFFRKVFNMSNVANIKTLAMDLIIDDGAVVFLNGREVARYNMPAGTTSATSFSSDCVDKATNQRVGIDPRVLVKGNNVLSIAVHQCSAGSSDLAFGLALVANGSGASAPAPVPTSAPTTAPTIAPTTAPTLAPTTAPTLAPTTAPTAAPTTAPTTAPTAAPTTAPTAQPTLPPVSGGQYYVTTSGSSTGDGSMAKPWSLAHAFSHPSALKPGDTVWVRGGTYNGQFTSRLTGTSSAYVTIRAYPGERAILRNTNQGPVLDIYTSSYTNYWGLEITSNYSSRTTSRSEQANGLRTYQSVSSHHLRFINMIIHDVAAQGFAWWQAMTDSEMYGSLIYYNGTTQLDHGIYTTNLNGTHAMIDNMIFDNASHGLHAYTESTSKALNNIYVEGNTFFNNGSVGYNTTKGTYGIYKRNILVGGTVRVNNATITNNFTYYPGTAGTSLNLGYKAGSYNSRVTNNYFAGGTFDLGGTQTSLSMTGNSVYAPAGVGGFSTSSYPNNTWTSSKPTGTRIFVRPNRYEANRANLTIYNWGKASTVAVPAANLGGITLKAGDTYELHNAQNFYGDVVTGVYDGNNIIVPMTNRSVSQPLGLSFRPASTFPEFGAFILIVKGS